MRTVKPDMVSMDHRTFHDITNAIAICSSLAVTIRAFEAADLTEVLGVDIGPVMESMRDTASGLEMAIKARTGFSQ